MDRLPALNGRPASTGALAWTARHLPPDTCEDDWQIVEVLYRCGARGSIQAKDEQQNPADE